MDHHTGSRQHHGDKHQLLQHLALGGSGQELVPLEIPPLVTQDWRFQQAGYYPDRRTDGVSSDTIGHIPQEVQTNLPYKELKSQE